MKKRSLVLGAVLTLLLLSGCGSPLDDIPSTSGMGRGKSCMQESLIKVDFGEVSVNSSSEEKIGLICSGSITLKVSITSGDSFSIKQGYTAVPTTGVAYPLVGITYIVFTPKTAGNHQGTVRFTDNNGDTYETSLVGTGR